MAHHGKPYYRAYPGDFLHGTRNLTAEEHGVYRTLLDLMYDRWEPVVWESLPRREIVRHRRELAATCGISVQGLNKTVERLLLAKKLVKLTAENTTSCLSNPRFERERSRITICSSENIDDSAQKLTAKITTGSNETNGLGARLTRARDSRVQSPDSTVPGKEGSPRAALSLPAEQVIESEIAQICKAIGVTLQASTHRHAWPARWVEMRTRHNLTVGDMVAAIESYTGQFRGESVKSLGLYKDRAIEKRTARELSDRIAGITHAREAADHGAVTRDQWSDRLKLFIELGSWASSYGPSPLEPGCVVPHDMLDKAERYWIEQGNHPRAMHYGGTKDPWAPGKAGSVRQVTPFAPRSSRAAA